MKNIINIGIFVLFYQIVMAQTPMINNNDYINPNCQTTGIEVIQTEIEVDPPDIPPINPPDNDPPGGGENDDRWVFWLHGYHGDRNSWDEAGFYVKTQYRVLNGKPEYDKNNPSLDSSAAIVRKYIDDALDLYDRQTDNFIIAHSMGGLVARTLGVMESPSGLPAYNGLITFGTPHQGVAAANTLIERPHVIQNYLNKTCKDLGTGPANEALATEYFSFGNIAVGLGLLNQGTNVACDLISLAFPILADQFVFTGIEAELTTQAAQSIPPMPTEHRAVFYGVEDDDGGSMAFRFFGSMLHPPGDFPLWGAGASDGLGMAFAADALNSYTERYDHWSSQSVPWWVWAFSPVFALLEESRLNKMTKAWKAGVDWFPTLNPTWKNMIGQTRFSEATYEGCHCIVWDFSQGYERIADEYLIPEAEEGSDCSVYEYDIGGFTWSECSPRYNFTRKEKKSDGFILEESAINGPGMNYRENFMPGSGHFQMRNDENTERAVELIFEEGLGAWYFRTDKK